MVFEVFRRRQKQMIALLAVLAMFAFVLSGFLMRSIDRTQRYVDRQVATAWGEPVMASQIEGMQRDRFVINQFFTLAFDRVNSKQRPPQWSTDAGDVISTLVVLEKARQLGLSIDDAEITQFIADRTENKLSAGAFHAVLADVGRSAISDRELYSIMGRELLFDKAINILAAPVARDTPLEHWESRLPALTHVQVELVRLPIQKYVDAKLAPPPAEIEKLFDAHKDQLASSEQGIIGFKEPHRVELEYLVADVTKLAEKVSVSEAEVKQYYEQHKEEFKVTPTAPQPEPSVPPPPAKPGEKDTKPDAKTPGASKTEPMPKPATGEPKGEVKSTETPGKEATPAPTKSQPGAKPSETKEKAAAKPPELKEKPATKPTSPNEKPQGKSNEGKAEKPAENQAKPGGATEKPAAKAPAKDGATLVPSLRGRLADVGVTGLLMLQESKPGERSAEKSAPQKTNSDAEKPQTKRAEKPAEKPVENPAEKVTEKPAVGKAAAEKVPEATGKAAPAAEKATSEQAPPPAYKPFEAVRAEIAQRLKREKAAKQAAEQLRNLLRTVMYEYLDAYGAAKRKFRYENPQAVEKDGELVGFTPPPAPDLKAIGTPLGFEFKSTGLLTEKELTDSPIGSIVQADDTFGASSFARTALSQDLYWGRVYQDLDGTHYYLCWKVKNRPARVPELDQVREQVVAAWRLQQARPKAKEQADKLAEEIKKAGGVFEKGLPKEGGYTIERTALFSRKIRRFSSFPFLEQNQYDEPNVPEIPDAGAELLDAVFKAPKGEILVKADARQQNFYILKVVERADPDFQEFVRDYDNEQRLMRAPGSVGRMLEMQRQFRETVEAICKEAGLEIKPTDESPPAAPDSSPVG